MSECRMSLSGQKGVSVIVVTTDAAMIARRVAPHVPPTETTGSVESGSSSKLCRIFTCRLCGLNKLARQTSMSCIGLIKCEWSSNFASLVPSKYRTCLMAAAGRYAFISPERYTGDPRNCCALQYHPRRVCHAGKIVRLQCELSACAKSQLSRPSSFCLLAAMPIMTAGQFSLCSPSSSRRDLVSTTIPAPPPLKTKPRLEDFSFRGLHFPAVPPSITSSSCELDVTISIISTMLKSRKNDMALAFMLDHKVPCPNSTPTSQLTVLGRPAAVQAARRHQERGDGGRRLANHSSASCQCDGMVLARPRHGCWPMFSLSERGKSRAVS